MTRPPFLHVVRSEVLKLATVPGTRLLALAVVAAGAVGSTMFGAGGAAGAGSTAATTNAVVGAASLAGSVYALLAGLSFASEYATGSVRTSLTTVPRRTELFLAKSAAVALVGLVLGALAAVLGAVVAQGGVGAAALPVVGSAVYVAVAGLFGLFIGGLVRHVAGTAVTVLVVVFLLPAASGGIRIGDTYLSDSLLGESGPALVGGTAAWDTPLEAVTLWLLVAAVAAAGRFRHTDA